MAELPSIVTTIPSATTPSEEDEGDPQIVEKFLPCSVHPDNHSDMFCESCEEVVCQECAAQGGAHGSHECAKVSAVFPKHRDELLAKVQPVYDQLAATNAALDKLRAEREFLVRQQEAVTREVNEEAQRIREALEERRKQLYAQIDEETERKLRNMREQRRRTVEVYSRLRAYYEYVQNMVETGSEMEVLSMSTTICQQARDITAALGNPEIFEPCEKADQDFSADGATELAEQLRNFGQITEYKSIICPEKCRAEGSGTEISVVGEPAVVRVHVVDQENREYLRKVDITFELVSAENPTLKFASGVGERNQDTPYDIRFNTTQRGLFKLHIRVNGAEIASSPFEVQSILLVSGLRQPWGVAVNSSRREVYVSESSGHCVSVFDAGTGDKLRSFGGRGNGPCQFDTPCAVAITPTGDLLVCDCNNHRLLLLSPEGTPLKSVGSKGKKALQFNEPVGVGVHPKTGKIYVTEFRNNRVQILNSDLTYSARFGRSGSEQGELSRPYGVGFDEDGKVYVSERGNCRIQVFSETGKHLRMFAGNSTEGGVNLEVGLREPVGVALDTSGRVFVSDVGKDSVEEFSSDGRFVRSVGKGCGQEAGQFRNPFGIAVDIAGAVYVADFGNGRLQII